MTSRSVPIKSVRSTDGQPRDTLIKIRQGAHCSLYRQCLFLLVDFPSRQILDSHSHRLSLQLHLPP